MYVCAHNTYIRTHTVHIYIHTILVYLLYHVFMLSFLSLLCALRLSLLTAELNFSKHLPLQQLVAEKGASITAMKGQQTVRRLKQENALLSNYVSKKKASERCVYSPQAVLYLAVSTHNTSTSMLYWSSPTHT